MAGKKGVLLVNLGTPDSPSIGDVRKYLREFLMDKRVLDVPYISRWLLVNLIIATFRGPKSAKEYQEVWEDRGSPLKFHSLDLVEKVREQLGEEYQVVLAMRYQNPSLKKVLEDLRKSKLSSLKVIPLFPQYASASTGSVQEVVMKTVKNWNVIPDIEFVSQFFDHPKLIETLADNAREKMKETDYDHFIFSYHGLPERHIDNTNIGVCKTGECCTRFTNENRYCYRSQCFETTRLLAKTLAISEEKVTTAFQSRLGKDPWIQPYIRNAFTSLAMKGKKKILVFSPSFVADCLETNLELAKTYKQEFIEVGGEKWDTVESLNSYPQWVACVVDMARS